MTFLYYVVLGLLRQSVCCKHALQLCSAREPPCGLNLENYSPALGHELFFTRLMKHFVHAMFPGNTLLPGLVQHCIASFGHIDYLLPLVIKLICYMYGVKVRQLSL